MKYYVKYSDGDHTIAECVETETPEQIMEYIHIAVENLYDMYEENIPSRDSYPDMDDETYYEMCESMFWQRIWNKVELFDETNPDHKEALEAQEGEFLIW